MSEILSQMATKQPNSHLNSLLLSSRCFFSRGMTSYLYAPKDDYKHRAYWRELYTVEEAEHLQSLISLATECDIDFYYAISPGKKRRMK